MKDQEVDFIKFAVEMEDYLYSFYTNASTTSRFQRIRTLFQNMAEQKKKNKNILCSISMPNISHSMNLEDFSFFRKTTLSLKRLYPENRKLAIQLEETAILFYSTIIDSVGDDDLKSVISSIIHGSKENLKIFHDQTFGK